MLNKCDLHVTWKHGSNTTAKKWLKVALRAGIKSRENGTGSDIFLMSYSNTVQNNYDASHYVIFSLLPFKKVKGEINFSNFYLLLVI